MLCFDHSGSIIRQSYFLCIIPISWYLYCMVTQNMLRAQEGKQVTDQIKEIAPYVRTYFYVTITYKYHGIYSVGAIRVSKTM